MNGVFVCHLYFDFLPSNLIPLKILVLPFHSSFHFILFNYLVQSITFIYIFLSHITHMLGKQFTATETAVVVVDDDDAVAVIYAAHLSIATFIAN